MRSVLACLAIAALTLGCGPSRYADAEVAKSQAEAEAEANATPQASPDAAMSEPEIAPSDDAAPDDAAAPDGPVSPPAADEEPAPPRPEPGLDGSQARPTQPATPAPPIRSQPAAPGVGAKSQGYDQFQKDPVQRIVSSPAATLFRARERIIFQIQIPKALQLHHAQFGKPPADDAEFERLILRPSRIQLPDLPANKRYRFDPKRGSYGELMVDEVR